MVRRWIAGLSGLLAMTNGLAMLVDGPGWYAAVPGVQDTGPFNPHFVQDIGIAFAAAGGGQIARALRPALWPAAVTGAAFITGHAVLHLVGLHHSRHQAFEVATLLLPALLAAWAAFPGKGEFDAQTGR